MKIVFNNIYCSTVLLEDANQFNNYSIVIPNKIISHSPESLIITFDFNDGIRPVNKKKKGDKRLLSAKINSFAIIEYKY